MAVVPCPPPPVAHMDWGTLIAGFVLGVVGSTGGAFVQALASSIMGRRDHQFERMLKATDDIRDDIERATMLAADYWTKPGSHEDCLKLEGEIVALQSKIVGTLALVKQLDPKRFEQIEAEAEEDFLDALTGGTFQVRDRAADAPAVERVRRYAGRLSEKVAKCSTSPTARRPFSRS